VSIVLVAVLLTATAITLLHWHTESAGQTCRICQLQHLPNLHNAVDVAYGVLCQRYSHCELPAEELEPSTRSTSSRAPPFVISFTV
jgi:hypothetical protein